MATIRDIAKKAQVSVSTVSRVLNNKPDVKAETKKKIDKAIEELGFSPSNVARGLVLKKSSVIGFIVPDIANPSFPELARGIVARARSLGYSVMFFDTNHDKHVEKEAINLMQGKHVDGIILSFNEANRNELEKLLKKQFPVVQIYRKSSKPTISTIALDNYYAGTMATNYLIQKGHRRIGLITTGKQTQSGYERLMGYKKALDHSGIEYDEDLVQVGENNADSGKGCMLNLLKLKRKPTAIFACHDLMAVGSYEAIYDKGFSIPEDISVIGHDNIDVSRYIRPKLTTIDTHKFDLGQAGVDLLLEEIQADQPLNKEVVIKAELIERDSVRELI
jgi:LacI family transcriptional regulator, galactose operon repressor